MCAVAHLQCSATLISAKYSSPLLCLQTFKYIVQWPTFSAVPVQIQ